MEQIAEEVIDTKSTNNKNTYEYYFELSKLRKRTSTLMTVLCIAICYIAL